MPTRRHLTRLIVAPVFLALAASPAIMPGQRSIDPLPGPTVAQAAAPADTAKTTVATDATTNAKKRATKKASCKRAEPRTAAAWQKLFTGLKGKFAIGDQSTSMKLPDGRTLWMFGDTIQGTLTRSGGVTRWRMPHNTIAITDRGCITHHTGAGGKSFIPDARNGEYYWPLSAVMDKGKLYMFSMRVRPTRDLFAGVGMELAELRYTRGGTPKFVRMRNTPATGKPETHVQWGAAATTNGGYTYVYGTQKVNQPYAFGKALYVARVPAGKLTNTKAWRYWNGTTWATSGPRQIHPAVGGVSTSLSVNKIGRSWVAVAKKNDMLGSEVVALTSSTPAGPWKEHVLTKTPGNLNAGDITYSAMSHPHLRLRSGKLLISVCRNNLDSRKVLANVKRGRPYFVEVTLPKV